VLFQPFVWSGRNSLAARRRAVQDLIERLQASAARWPRARHYVVGHSHGGNIAFQALADPALNQWIAGLVCLSTPFLHVAPRDLGPVGRTALDWFPVVLIFYGSALTVRLAAPAYEDTIGPWLLVVSAAAGFLIHRTMRRRQATVPSFLEYPVVDPAKVIMLRVAGDEASAAFGAAHLISWMAGRLWLATSRLLAEALATAEGWRTAVLRHRVVAGCIAVWAITGIVVIVGLPTAPRWVEGTAITGISAGLMMAALLARGGLFATVVGRFLLAAMATPFLLAVAVVGGAIGPELVFTGLLFQVTAEPTPPGFWHVWQLTGRGRNGEDGAGGLMHSASYQNPQALRILGDWMTRTERGLQNSVD
jgi:hypothetical protein